MDGTSNHSPIQWKAVSGQVPGCGHVERGIPCQDRADAWAGNFPGLMVLDGRGSAALSHVGAAAAKDSLRDIIRDSDRLLASILDAPARDFAEVAWQGLAGVMYHAAASEQLKLADWYQMDAGSFEFTLTLVIMGERWLGWLAVGDCPLVITRHGVTALATEMAAGEFANQTSFITATPGSRLGMQGGVIPVEGVRSIVAMSDGSASRLVHHQNQQPALAVSEIVERVVSKDWEIQELVDVLEDPAWDRVTRDDRSLAILAAISTPAGRMMRHPRTS